MSDTIDDAGPATGRDDPSSTTVVHDPARGTRRVTRERGRDDVHRVERADGTTLLVRRDPRHGAVRVDDDDGALLTLRTDGDAVVGIDRLGTTTARRDGTSTRIERRDGARAAVLRIDRDDQGRPRRVTVPGSASDLHVRPTGAGSWRIEADDGATVATISRSGAATTVGLAGGWGWTEHRAPGAVTVTAPDGTTLATTRLDRGGRILGRRSADGTEHVYDHDGRGRLVGWSSTGPAGSHDVTWEHAGGPGPTTGGVPDGIPGGIRGVVVDGRRRRWRSDGGGRVTAIIGGPRSVRFDHDATGNRTARRTRMGTTTYTTDALGQVTGIDHPDGTHTAMAWDALGRRVQVDHDGRRLHEHRDVDGRLWAVTDETGAVRHLFLWWDGRVLARLDGPVGAPVAEAYVTDPHGTLLAVATPGTTGADGRGEDGPWQVLDTVGSPWGQVTGPYRPTLFGHVSDAGTGLVCFGSRLYDPETASFLTPDPWHLGDDDPRLLGGADPATLARLQEAPTSGIHPYALSQFDPLDRPDVDGHFAWGNFFLTLFLAPTWGFPLTSLSVFFFLPVDLYFELIGLIVFIFTDHPWPQHSLVNMKGASASGRLGTAALELNGLLPRATAGGVGGDRAVTIGHVVWANRRYFELLDRPRVLMVQDVAGAPDATGAPSLGPTAFSRTPAGSIVVVEGTDRDHRLWIHASWWTRGGGTHVGVRGSDQVLEDRVAPPAAHSTGPLLLAQPLPEHMATPRSPTDGGTLRVTEYPTSLLSTGELVQDQWFAVAVDADTGIGAGDAVRIRTGDDAVAPAFAAVQEVLVGASPILLLDVELPLRFHDDRHATSLRVARLGTTIGAAGGSSAGWTAAPATADTPARRSLQHAAPVGHRLRTGDVLAITPSPAAPAPERPVVHGVVESLRLDLELTSAVPAGLVGGTLVALVPDGTIARATVPDRDADPGRITVTGDLDLDVDDLVVVQPVGGVAHHARISAITAATDTDPAVLEVTPEIPATVAPTAATPVRVARLVAGDRDRDAATIAAATGTTVTVTARSTDLFPDGSPVLAEQGATREVRTVVAAAATVLVLADEMVPASGPVLGPDFAIAVRTVDDDEHPATIAADRFVRHVSGHLPAVYGSWPDQVMGLVPQRYSSARAPSGWRFFVRSSTPIPGLHPDFREQWQPLTLGGTHYWLLSSPLQVTRDGDDVLWEPDPDDTYPRRHRQNLLAGTPPVPNWTVTVRGFARATPAVTRPLPGGTAVWCRPLETLVPEEPRVRWSLADSLDEHELMHTVQNTFWGPLLGSLPLQGMFRTAADTVAATGSPRPDWMMWNPFDETGDAVGFDDTNVFELLSMAGLMQLAWTFIILGPALLDDDARHRLLGLDFADWGQVFNPVNQQIINHVPEVDPDADAGDRWGLNVANLLARAVDMRSWTPLIGMVPLLLPDGPTNFIEQQASRASGDLYSTIVTVDDHSNRTLRMRMGTLLSENRDGNRTVPLGDSARVMVFLEQLGRWLRLDRCDAPTDPAHVAEYFSVGFDASRDHTSTWIVGLAGITVDAVPGTGPGLVPHDLYEYAPPAPPTPPDPPTPPAVVTTRVVEGPATDPATGSPLTPRPATTFLEVQAGDVLRPRARALVPAAPAVTRAAGFYLVPGSEGTFTVRAYDTTAGTGDKDAFTWSATVTVAGTVRLDDDVVAWALPLAQGDPGPPPAPTTGDVSRVMTQRAHLVVDGQDTTGWAIEVGPGLAAEAVPAGQGWTVTFGDPGTGFPARSRLRIWRPVRGDDADLFDFEHDDEPTHAGIRSYLDEVVWLPVRDCSVETTELGTLADSTMAAHAEHVRNLPIPVAGAGSIVVTPTDGRTLVHEPVGDGAANREWRFTLDGRRAVEEPIAFPVRVRFGQGATTVDRTFTITVEPSIVLDTTPAGGPREVGDTAGALALAISGGTPPYEVDGALPTGLQASIGGATVTLTTTAGAGAGSHVLVVRDAADRLGIRTVTILGGPPTPAGVHRRRSAWDLASGGTWDPVLEAYARAVARMQARPASDPTSWSFQAALHGSYVGPPSGSGPWAECQHEGWFFLPWHRMYLYWFERIVRAAVVADGGPADFAIPYWNYEEAAPRNSLPLAFREPTLPDGTANPLSIPARRQSTVAAGGQLPSSLTSSAAAMATVAFSLPAGIDSFGGAPVGPSHFRAGGTGQLEQQPHNVIHGAVGGAPGTACAGRFMSDGNCAALDPIFWLHHANIDRLWEVWLAQGGGRRNPTATAWLDRPFELYDENGAVVSLTPADVLATGSQLDYVYA